MNSGSERFVVDIYGSGPEEGSLNEMIQSSGLQNTVNLKGIYKNEDLPKMLSNSLAIIVPSVIDESGDMDGIPTVIYEAMTLGRAVIASRISGIPEVVLNNINGYLVDSGDAPQLANRMDDMLKNPTISFSMGKKGRRLVERNHDYVINARALIEEIDASMNSQQKIKNKINGRIKLLLMGPLPPPVGGTTTSFQELVDAVSNDESIQPTILNISRSQKVNIFANMWVGMLSLLKSMVHVPKADIVALNLSNSGFLIFGTFISPICKLFNKPVLFRVFGGSLDLYWEQGGKFRKFLLRKLFYSGTVLLQTKLLTDYFSAKFPKAEIY